MHNLIWLICTFVMLLVFVACGEGKIVSVTTTENHPRGMDYIAAGDSMPKCNDSTAGTLLLSGDSNKVLFCNGDNWRGLNGRNGTNGKDGIDGTNGTNGSDAIDGQDGDFCWAELKDSIYNVFCGEDTVSINLNIHTPNTCTTETFGDSAFSFICGKDSIYITANKPGKPGEDCYEANGDEGIFYIICGTDSTTHYRGICGETPYNPEGDKFCAGINLFEKCNGKVYDPKVVKCVDGSIKAICGETTYDPLTEICLPDGTPVKI